jgi:hypothetical protein
MDEKDFLTGGHGLENLTAQDLGRPFLKICQQMTPERQKANGELYIDGLNEGDIFNSVTKKNYGASVEVRFLARAKIWLVFDWGTDGKDGNFAATVAPNSFPVDTANYALWAGEFEGAKVRVKEGYNMVALVVGEEQFGPVIIPFFGMGNHDAQALTQKLGTDRDDNGNLLSIFARSWQLMTNPVKRDKNVFYLYGDGKKSVNAKRSVETLTFAEFNKTIAPLLQMATEFIMIADRDAKATMRLTGPDSLEEEI